MNLLAFGLGAAIAASPFQPDFQQGVEYRIEARLNATERLLTGRSRVAYTNRSPDTIGEAYFHLHPNTYRDRFSTAAREKAFYHDETIARIPARDRGYLDVERMRVDGEPVGFQVLDTVLRLELPRPLAPGATAIFELEWFEKVRLHVEGGGVRGRHYELADWYPRIAAYDARGWHAEPTHDAGGRYAELASFDVTLDLPADLVVGATGELVSGQPGWAEARRRAGASAPDPEVAAPGAGEAGRKLVRFRAERVTDFAWIADPDYRCEERDAGRATVRVLYRGASAERWRGRALARVLDALDGLAELGIDLPWPQLTVADALVAEPAAQPMLVRTASAGEPDLVRGIARALVASIPVDSGAEPWLEQGLAEWAARRVLIARHGPAGVDPGDLDGYEQTLRRTPLRDRAQQSALHASRFGLDEPAATPGHRFRDRANRLPAARDRASLFLDAVRHAVGPEEFAAGLADYVRRHRDRPGSETALRRSLEEASGQDLDRLFRHWLHTTRVADLGVSAVRSEPGPAGFRVEVDVRRRGGLATPVDLLVRGEDGAERRVRWDAAEPRATLVVEDLPSAPALVWLDPEAMALDPDRLDNRRPLDVDWVLDRPFQDAHPRDAYVVSWRPSAWYNGIDGVRAGAVLEGSREGVAHRFKLAPSVGARTGRVDAQARYATPLFALGRTGLEGEAHRAEGRLLLRGLLRTNLSPRLERRPQTRVEIGFSSFEVTGAAYLQPERDSLGTINQVWIRYGGSFAGPGWEGESWLRYQVSGPQLDSDFAFQRLALGLQARTTRARTVVKLRGFLGLSSDGDVLPRQERFYLASAGPLEEFEHAGLRSRDALLRYLNYHLPGGGNFRAYNGFPVSARRLFTFNFEAERPLGGPLAAALRDRAGAVWLALFADLGKAEGTGVADLSNPLFGLGAGVRLRRTVYGREVLVRLDLPFYANRPGFDEDGEREERVAPRWLLSFSPAL